MHVSISASKRRWEWFGRIVDGTPVIVCEKGEWHEDRMRTLRMLESDIMAAVRQRPDAPGTGSVCHCRARRKGVDHSRE